MAKSNVEEKVNQLAETKVDSFIRRNENKLTTGRNVRPVIESWADELDRIANSTDEDITPEEASRLKKAENALRNLLKNRDDDLTYFIVNAPKKFWGTLRYIFEDTFTPRTYDPQPLTKYEIPQHLNQVAGMKPEPKKKPVDTSIPKPKKNPVSRGRIDHPKFKPGSHAQITTSNQKEDEAEEEQDDKYDDMLSNEQYGGIIGQSKNPIDISEILQTHHQKEPVEVFSENNDQHDLRSLWKMISDVSHQVMKNEEQSYGEINRWNPEKGLLEFEELTANLHAVISRIDITDKNAGKILGAAITPLRNRSVSSIINAHLTALEGSEELDDNRALAAAAQKAITETPLLIYGENGFSMPEDKVRQALNVLDANVNDLNDLCRKMILNVSALQENLESRLSLLKDIIDEHQRAASTGNTSVIKHRINDAFYNPKKDPAYWKTAGVEQAIQRYLDTQVRTKAFKRLQLLIKAAKRLNSYVKQS